MNEASAMLFIAVPIGLFGGLYGATWFMPWWWGRVTGNPVPLDRARVRGIVIGYGLFGIAAGIVFAVDAISGKMQ